MRNRTLYLTAAVAALACLLYPSTSGGQEYELVLSWPEEILGLRYPTGVAVDSSGNIYVADPGNYRIQRFDSEGNFLTAWGTLSSGGSQFSTLNGIAIDASGNIYVTDTRNRRIRKLSPAKSSSSGRILKPWVMDRKREINPLAGHTGDVKLIVPSPDGKYALSGSYDDTLRLWDINTGEEIRIFAGHEESIASMALSPDGRYALSGSYDRTIKLWEVATGREVRTFTGHTFTVESVAFSPDGRYALSASGDRTIRLWDIGTGELLLTHLHLDQTDWFAVSPDGRFDGSPEGIRLLHLAKDNEALMVNPGTDLRHIPKLMALVLHRRTGN